MSSDVTLGQEQLGLHFWASCYRNNPAAKGSDDLVRGWPSPIEVSTRGLLKCNGVSVFFCFWRPSWHDMGTRKRMVVGLFLSSTKVGREFRRLRTVVQLSRQQVATSVLALTWVKWVTFCMPETMVSL